MLRPTNFRAGSLKLSCTAALLCALLAGCSGGGSAPPKEEVAHPHPMPRPGPSTQTFSADGSTTFVVTPNGGFPSSDGTLEPPGSNFLKTVYTNAFDGNGNEMPNTLPSTPQNPYNLHDGPVVTSSIEEHSPTTDLRAAFKSIREQAANGIVDLASIQRSIDIIEGNPLSDRVYSGFPLLHYKGPEKVKVVTPLFDNQGQVTGGEVHVHQVWYDSHIESDTAFIDPSAVREVPWTIIYTVDVLHRAHDDFSPFVMYLDDPALTAPGPPLPHVAMDQSFFPMNSGSRNIFRIKMSRGKYYNLSYTWGWRVHPPRVQVSENALKKIGGRTLPQWESDVFGPNPSASEANKLAAIAKIGDNAPAKVMWTALRAALQANAATVLTLMDEAQLGFDDWFNRRKLPHGYSVDPTADMTLVYLNNTIYGEMANGRTNLRWSEWTKRPATFKVALVNGDFYQHAYTNVDFGGSRGWENQFQSTVASGGSGCWFSFGRVHWWINAGGPDGLITVPPATGPSDPGHHRVELTLNFDPSRRLRLYQFDPLHHDVAVLSIH